MEVLVQDSPRCSTTSCNLPDDPGYDFYNARGHQLDKQSSTLQCWEKSTRARLRAERDQTGSIADDECPSASKMPVEHKACLIPNDP